MPLLMRCNCGKPLRVPDELAGKKVRCPSCQTVLPVPGGAPAVAQPVAVAVAAAPSAVRRPRPAAPPREARAAPDEPARRRAAPARPRRQIVPRILVLVLALPGAGLAGYLGFLAYRSTHDATEIAAVQLARAVVEEGDKAKASSENLESFRQAVKRFDQRRVACYFLLAACLLGVAGGVLALLRRGRIACPLLILPAVGAAVVMPVSAILTSPLLAAGLLALLIRPAPRRPPGPVLAEAR
jgi:hypothetical protein